MYKRVKLTVAKRSTIQVGAVVELEVNENVNIPRSLIGCQYYGEFHLRKQFAMKGLFQAVSTPFPDGYVGKPTVVVENRHVADVELIAGEELGELWMFGG